MREKLAFDIFAESESRQGSICADDAMTGNDQADRIRGVGPADGARSGWLSERGGKLAVAPRFAEGNFPQGSPDQLLERCAWRGECKRELPAFTKKVRAQINRNTVAAPEYTHTAA